MTYTFLYSRMKNKPNAYLYSRIQILRIRSHGSSCSRCNYSRRASLLSTNPTNKCNGKPIGHITQRFSGKSLRNDTDQVHMLLYKNFSHDLNADYGIATLTNGIRPLEQIIIFAFDNRSHASRF